MDHGVYLHEEWPLVSISHQRSGLSIPHCSSGRQQSGECLVQADLLWSFVNVFSVTDVVDSSTTHFIAIFVTVGN